MRKTSKMAERAKKRAKHREQKIAQYLRLPDTCEVFNPKAGETYVFDILSFLCKKDLIDYQQGGSVISSKGETWYEYTFFVHFGLPGDVAALCMKTFGKPCKICNSMNKIIARNTEASAELAKKIKPKERQLFIVRNRKSNSKKYGIMNISFFNFGEKLIEEMANYEDDAVYGMAEPKGGYTLKAIFKEKTMGAGKPFAQCSRIDFKPREEDYTKAIKNAPFLPDLLVVPPDDIASRLAKDVLLMDSTEASDDEDEGFGSADTGRPPADDDFFDTNDDEEEELDDEIEDDEEEEDDEESLSDILKKMTRKQLKEYKNENGLDVRVTKSMSDDDIRDAILAAIQEGSEDEDEEEEDGELPF